MIKLFSPYIPEGVIANLTKTLSSGCITQGDKVDEFEKEFSKLFNVRYAVSMNSGTSALETAYDLIGLKEGDEVITTPLTCAATNIPLLARKVKIVWADINERTLCIDALDIKSKITDKTKAIIQVHLGGVCSNIGVFHIPVVSDACQALGIFTGDLTACSFQAIKHITTGDGGMLVVNNKEAYQKAKLLRWFGIDREIESKNSWESYKTRMMCFDIEMLGYKRHMNDIAATMGLAGLSHYRSIVRHRKKIFNIYKINLLDLSGIKLIDGETNVCWLATVLVERRDDFARKLFDAGIETNLVQVRNDIYKLFGRKREDLPVLNSIEDKYISIPIGMHVSEEDAHYISETIKGGW